MYPIIIKLVNAKLLNLQLVTFVMKRSLGLKYLWPSRQYWGSAKRMPEDES